MHFYYLIQVANVQTSSHVAKSTNMFLACQWFLSDKAALFVLTPTIINMRFGVNTFKYRLHCVLTDLDTYGINIFTLLALSLWCQEQI